MPLAINGGTLELDLNFGMAYPYGISDWSSHGSVEGFNQTSIAYGQQALSYYDAQVSNDTQVGALSRHPGESSGAYQTSPLVSATALKFGMSMFFDQSHRGIAFDTGTITQGTYGITGSNVSAYDRLVFGGTHFGGTASTPAFNGHLAEGALWDLSQWGALNAGTFVLNQAGIDALAALRAGAKAETVLGYVATFPMRSSTDLTSIDGTKTLTLVGGGLSNSGLPHPVTRAAIDTTRPTVAAAAVANGTPTIVNLTMSEALDAGFVPAASSFTIAGHPVTAVAISGSTINLTTSAAFVNGEAARTVAYAQPGTNNARDIAGNLLANFSGQAITNNVAAPGDTTAPTLSTAQVLNSAPTQIVLTFSETLGAFTPAAAAFAVSGGKSVTGVARSGSQITLTCSAAYANGDTITASYTKPGTNPIQDLSGNQTNSFGPAAVTNNVTVPGSTVTFTAKKKLTARADGAVAASVSIHAFVYDKATGALVGTTTGLSTSSGGIPVPFTASFGAAGTEYDVKFVDDANPRRRSLELITPV